MTSLFILLLAIVLTSALVKKAKTDDRIGALIGGIVGVCVGSGVGLAFSGDAINGAVVFALVGGLIGYVMAANLGFSEHIKTARLKIKAELAKNERKSDTSVEAKKSKPTAMRKNHSTSPETKASIQQGKKPSIPKRRSASLPGLGKFAKFITICSVLIFVIAGWVLAQVVLTVDPNVSPETVSFEYFLGVATVSGGLVALVFIVFSPFALLSKKVRNGINGKPFVPPLIVFLPPGAVFLFLLLGQAALHDILRTEHYADGSRSNANGNRSTASSSGPERRYNSANATRIGSSSGFDYANTSLEALFDSINSELPFRDGSRNYVSVNLSRGGLVWRVDLQNTARSAFRDPAWRNNLITYETDWICTNPTLRAVLEKGFTHTLSYYVDNDQWEMRIKYSESDCM